MSEKRARGQLPPKTMTPRPKISPYGSDTIILRVGPRESPYRVHRDIVPNLTWKERATTSWGQEIPLPDVDEDTGHTLVHYLYTEEYQTLEHDEPDISIHHYMEFKKAVSAYITAANYDLPGLKELAVYEIEDYGKEINILDIISAVNDSFSKLPKDDRWLCDYLATRIKKALEKESRTFTKGKLIDRVENLNLSKLLTKTMLDFYCDEIFEKDYALRSGRDVARTGTSANEVAPYLWEASNESEDTAGYNEFLDAVKPTEPDRGAEQVSHGWDFGFAPTDRKKASEENNGAGNEEMLPPMKSRPEAVVEDVWGFADSSAATTDKLQPPPADVETEAELGAPKVDVWDFADKSTHEGDKPDESVSSSSKERLLHSDSDSERLLHTVKEKKKKKKQTRSNKNEELPPPPPPPEPLVDDGWGSFSIATKKKKNKKGKSKKTVGWGLAEEPVAHEEKAQSWDDWGVEPTEDEKQTIGSWNTDYEPSKQLFTADQDPSGRGGWGSANSKEDEKAWVDVESSDDSALHLPALSSTSVVEEQPIDDWDGWGPCPMPKKKKGKKVKSKKPVFTPPPSSPEGTLVDLGRVFIQTDVDQGNGCFFREEHLRDESEWSKCKPCRAFMTQVADNLAPQCTLAKNLYELLD